MGLRLEDIELIKQLKYRYCRALDIGDFAALTELLTEDIAIDYRGGTYHFALAGRDAVIGAMKQAFYADFVGSHTVHMPVITVHDDDTADGEWTLLDYAVKLDQGNEATSGSAIYTDHYLKQGGQWRIARSSYIRVYERVYTEHEVGLKSHLLRDNLLGKAASK